MTRLSVLFCLFLSLFAATARAETTVFAAASLRDALIEIARDTGAPIRLSAGGSGSMARQIAGGAPADVVILAHDSWMGWLAQKDLLLGDPVALAGNRLVLVAPIGTQAFSPDATSLMAALDGGRLAMGQRDAVPAGIYARQWLAHIGAWDALSPHLAETDNVRAALALVASRATPLGLVYASDALAEPRVAMVYEIPAGQHDPITYPAAALTPHGAELLALLRTPKAAAVFAAHGFDPVAP